MKKGRGASPNSLSSRVKAWVKENPEAKLAAVLKHFSHDGASAVSSALYRVKSNDKIPKQPKKNPDAMQETPRKLTPGIPREVGELADIISLKKSLAETVLDRKKLWEELEQADRLEAVTREKLRAAISVYLEEDEPIEQSFEVVPPTPEEIREQIEKDKKPPNLITGFAAKQKVAAYFLDDALRYQETNDEIAEKLAVSPSVVSEIRMLTTDKLKALR